MEYIIIERHNLRVQSELINLPEHFLCSQDREDACFYLSHTLIYPCGALYNFCTLHLEKTSPVLYVNRKLVYEERFIQAHTQHRDKIHAPSAQYYKKEVCMIKSQLNIHIHRPIKSD